MAVGSAATRRDRPTPYKGESGNFMWVLHRVTGILVLFFLFLHVVDTATILWGPEIYNEVVEIYKNFFFRVFMEVPLVGAVLFHSFNGLRVLAIDLTNWGARRQKELSVAVLVVTLLFFVPSAYIMLRPVLFSG
ncbi:MAG TPA: succinate dehydrogenase, cytochrome b556 subunit [Actinomycetota bacterium]|nr:succinate dehydrogenase, cytochrome b556 subunit [Actinomycetota bacterium]